MNTDTTTEQAEQVRRRERWKRGQKARRKRFEKEGRVDFRAWLMPDDAAWVTQTLKERRTNEDVLARRRERLQRLMRQAKRADASSRDGTAS